MYIYDKDSSCTHSDVLSDYHTFTYSLRAIWHIRPQHFLCQLLRFVTHFSSSIWIFPFFSLPSSLPRLRRPSGVQVIDAVLHSLFGSFLTMWLKWISISFTRPHWSFLSQPSARLLLFPSLLFIFQSRSYSSKLSLPVSYIGWLWFVDWQCCYSRSFSIYQIIQHRKKACFIVFRRIISM